MDDGVLRVEATRAAAVKWWKDHCLATRVISRYAYSSGYYGYVVGDSAEDGEDAAIVREDKLPRYGITTPPAAITPLYPHADRPHDQADDDTDEPAEANHGDAPEREMSMDKGLDLAFQTIQSEARSSPHDYLVRSAFSYLDARIPVSEREARRVFVELVGGITVWREAQPRSENPVLAFRLLVREPADRLAAIVASWPPLPSPRSRAEFAEIAKTIGVGFDWHEPDEAEVDAIVTEGGLDNAGHELLEKQVIIRKEGEPVAQVPLATVLAWASTLDH
jgi:hypothetical protein